VTQNNKDDLKIAKFNKVMNVLLINFFLKMFAKFKEN